MLHRRLDVLVHCRGGLGRAGTIAARLLVELGMDPTKAIVSVRAARPDTIENCNQENYVKNIGLAQNNREKRAMDWFERLTGFCEVNYDDTRAKLRVDGNRLQSLVNGKSYGIGALELVSLQELRGRVKSNGGLPGRLKGRGGRRRTANASVARERRRAVPSSLPIQSSGNDRPRGVA